MVSWLAGLAMLLPGLCWWAWAEDTGRDPLETLAGVIGFSAGFITLVTLGFYLVRVPMSDGWFWGLGGLLLALSVAGIARREKRALGWPWLAALVLVALIAAWRFWQAKGLVLPNWVDSLHHTLIVRKMVEAQGLTSTLDPYLPGAFTYHFAFHAIAAVFSRLSGIAPSQSILLTGHVVSMGISLGGYTLVKTLSKDWRPAVFTALLIAFVTRMPGYYVSWGRYTLLAGMMFLPMAIAQSLKVWNGARDWGNLALLLTLVGGTLLSHYLVAFLLGMVLVVLGLSWVLQSAIRRNWDWAPMVRLVITALLGLVLVSPWYYRALKYTPAFVEPTVQLSQIQAGTKGQWDYLFYLVGPLAGQALLTFALGGLIWGLFKKEARSLSIWTALVGLFSLPFGWRFFGFRSDYFGLTLFMPVSVLAGLFFFWGTEWLDSKQDRKNIALALAMLVGLGMVLWGTWQNQDVINDETVLADQSDITALDWINDHTPKDARFFVNTKLWGYGMYRGVGGGAWILPYTGRWAIAPTIFYTFGGDQATAAQWADWSLRASKVETCGTDFWELVEEAGLAYVYVREGSSTLKASALNDCSGLRQLYNSEGVSIWLITPDHPSPDDL